MDRPRLDDRAARRGHPAEALPLGYARSGTAVLAAHACPLDRVHGVTNGCDVDARREGKQALAIDLYSRAKVVTVLAPHKNANVHRLTTLDVGERSQHGVLENCPVTHRATPG